MSFQNKHNRITFMYTFRFEEIGSLIAVIFHLSKRKGGFITFIIAPYHCYFSGIGDSYFINNIKGKVEIFRDLYFELSLKFMIRIKLNLVEVFSKYHCSLF